MVLSNCPQALAASCGVMVSRILFCWASMSASLKFDGFGIPGTPTRLPDHCAGNHEPPLGQSEHQPLIRMLTGALASDWSVRMLAAVEAIGVTLNPAFSKPLTISSLPATRCASSLVKYHLSSYSPGL